MLAKTSFGLEEVLEKELIALGATNIEKQNRAVTFEGDLELLYKANLWLRSCNRILVPFHWFKISDTDDLYPRIKKIKWEEIFSVDQTFAIDSTVFSELYSHTKYPALKAKDAIVDRFRDHFDKRPNVDIDNPDIKINLHINNNDECTVSLDSSGTPLFKRGYRDSQSIAPIKEDLAAGLILLTDWDKNSNFIDLFCGSGTLLIEAAMMAYNIPPNIKRENFGFSNWKNYDEPLFQKLVKEATLEKKEFNHQIIGVDISRRVLGMAKVNIKSAGFSEKIELHEKSFADYTPTEGNGIIVSNPPYGERLDEDVDELYKEFGNTLKAKYNGYNAWFISSNMEALKKVGLRPSRKIKVFNGSLECRLMKYEMYRGTKKIHKLNKKENIEDI